MILCSSVFFFNVAPTTAIYTLSLHDALPISRRPRADRRGVGRGGPLPRRRFRPPLRQCGNRLRPRGRDRKSTRLNSSHSQISYAVFCLKKKTQAVVAVPVPVDTDVLSCSSDG